MPELPEVEVVKQGLEKILSDHPKLEKVEFKRSDLREPIPIAQINRLVGLRVERIERRAKYLLLWTSRGAMLSHLGMTGTWRLAPPGEELVHDHIYLYFSNRRLAYRDPRRFGYFDFVQIGQGELHPRLKDLGPEPLSAEFDGEVLWQSLRGKKVSIKNAIMDQKVVVGVGNIYANEALFLAGIKPQLRAEKLSYEKASVLTQKIKDTLSKAIQFGGSTISDFAQASGGTGYFQTQFQVYDRAGEACYVCRSKIQHSVIGGRSTYRCPRCQK